MTSAMKRHPAIGWVRADQVPSGTTLADVLALRNRVAELEAEAKDAALVPPAGTEDLEHGEDQFTVHATFIARNPQIYTKFLSRRCEATSGPATSRTRPGILIHERTNVSRSSVREEVPSLRILRTCPYLANKPALHQSN